MRKFLGFVLLLLVVGAVAFFMFGPSITESMLNKKVAHEPYVISPEAARLHETLVIGDWHADPLMYKRNLLKRATRGNVDLPRLTEGNYALQMFTTVTKSPAGLNYESNSAEARDQITLLTIAQLWPPRTYTSRFERALYQSEKLHSYEADAPDTLKIIRTKADLAELLAARENGSKIVGGMLGAEGGHALDGEIGNLKALYDAGFRLIGITHFFDNALGGSLHGQSNAGLTDFGRQVVEEMVQRSMIIDLAHASPKVAREVLAMTDTPVVVSHTGIHSHCEVKRNFPDDLMQAIAAEGGLIAIGFWEDVTCDATPKGVAAAIIAAVELVGEDHVSLGSDYDGSVETTFDSSEIAALTQALLDAGASEGVIAKVMGGNMVRFLQAGLPD